MPMKPHPKSPGCIGVVMVAALDRQPLAAQWVVGALAWAKVLVLAASSLAAVSLPAGSGHGSAISLRWSDQVFAFCFCFLLFSCFCPLDS